MHKVDEFIKDKNGLKKICVVGLGYVGLPLTVLLDTKYNVIGFDISENRIDELKGDFDRTREVESEDLKNSGVLFSADATVINEADVVIVTVPTPIDEHNKPDISLVESASSICGKNLKKGAVVVYESTVYPGLTEDICVPIIEKESGFKWKEDFNVGYSPERVNPGDKLHTIDKIIKVVAGDTDESAEFLSSLYGGVITAGIHKARDIKTAEAAKVIENTQRDINIALMNELASICDKLDIDTGEVLAAAGTKWNFLKFFPGLVGGHCIGVDPYYLTHKAEELGVNPKIILAGRSVNDAMGKFVAEKTVKELIKAGKAVSGAKILIMGLTFKENCPDTRNTKVIDVYKELKEYGTEVDVFDTEALAEEVVHEYGIELIKPDDNRKYDAVVLAVRHDSFMEMLKNKFLLNNLSPSGVVIDVKGMLDSSDLPEGSSLWRL